MKYLFICRRKPGFFGFEKEWKRTESIGTNYLFARKSFRLFLIDSGYFVVFFVVMGAILGAW